MTTDFAFRISASYEMLELSPLFLMCEKVIVYQHEADEEVSRTHIHGLLMGCSRKEDTIRNKFFKGVYKAGDYELKCRYKQGDLTYPVGDSYITYMSKGSLEPVHAKGYALAEIEDWKSKWVKPLTQTKIDGGAKRVKSATGNKKTRKEIIDVLRNGWKAEYGGEDPHEALEYIRTVLIRENEVIGLYKVIEYYDSLMMYCAEYRWLNMVRNKIISRNRV